ncbi:MAG: FliO/MopB family protein [Victivallaceae bacterium]
MPKNQLKRILRPSSIFDPLLSSDNISDNIIEDSVETMEVTGPFPTTMKTEFLKMGLSLFLLLTIFTVCVWAFKKFLKNRSTRFNKGSSAIKILDQRALSHKSVLYIVQVVDKILIIAESSEEIRMLSEFPEKTDLNTVMSELQSKKKAGSFSTDFITKTVSRLGKKLSSS